MARADLPVFLDLIDALADYEHLDRPDAAARERLAADAFADPPRYEPLLAEVSPGGAPTPRPSAPGEPARQDEPAQPVAAGYAVFFMTYSTFLARPTLYLEDIFVRPECRGRGAGRALFDACAALAVERGCGRMEWVVLASIEFSARRGARHLPEWRHFRLDGDALAAFRCEHAAERGS
jgi:GNAT superfamily N-acetyltransferase